MNSYQQYMAENDLAYCTLFPNVGDVFPLPWTSEHLVQICSLKTLLKLSKLEIETAYLEQLESVFKAEDLCFCFQQGILLIPSWDGQSDSYQKLNLLESLRLDKFEFEDYKKQDELLKANVDFDFHEMDDNIPWISSHIFLLNSHWKSAPIKATSAYWNLSLDKIDEISDWENRYHLSFKIYINDKPRFHIALFHDSFGESIQEKNHYL